MTNYFKDILKQKTQRHGNKQVDLYSVTNDGIIPRSDKYNIKLSDDYSNNKIIEYGDVVFGNSRHTLNFGVLLEKVTGSVSSVYNAFEIDQTLITPEYLNYYLLFNRRNMLHILKPGARDNRPIDKDLLFETKIFLPSLDEQNKITNTLNTIKNIIDLRLKIIGNLEELAKITFNTWFVEFEFPNIEGLPYKSNNGKMIDTEMGLIPDGWEVKELKEIVSHNSRGFPPKYNEDNTGIEIINQRCVRNHTILREAVRYHDPSLGNVPEDKYHKAWDVLINSMGVGTLGRVAVSSRAHNKIVHSVITILRANENIILPPIFSYMMLSLENTFERMGEGSTGQTSLSKKYLSSLKVVVPPMELQEEINNTFFNIQKNIDDAYLEIEKLEKYKQKLLIKLMSGNKRESIEG